jgi:hypothetical protein
MNSTLVLKSTAEPELKNFRVKSQEEFSKTEKPKVLLHLISQKQFSKKKLKGINKQIASVYNSRPPLLGTLVKRKY